MTVYKKDPAFCNYVQPSQQSKCKSQASQVILKLPHGPVHIGKTATSGNQALVVVVGSACVSSSSSGGSGSSGNSGTSSTSSTSSGGSGNSGSSSTSSGGSSGSSGASSGGSGSSGQGGSGKSAAAALPAANSGNSGSSGSQACITNTNPSKGLPSGSTSFSQAYQTSSNSSTDPASRCVKVKGLWYVDLS